MFYDLTPEQSKRYTIAYGGKLGWTLRDSTQRGYIARVPATFGLGGDLRCQAVPPHEWNEHANLTTYMFSRKCLWTASLT